MFDQFMVNWKKVAILKMSASGSGLQGRWLFSLEAERSTSQPVTEQGPVNVFINISHVYCF